MAVKLVLGRYHPELGEAEPPLDDATLTYT